MRSKPFLITATTLFGLAVVVVLLLQSAFNKPCCHDEEQYVFASLLTVNLSLYRDFIYLQPPYLPLLHAAAFSLIDTHYLLAARLGAFSFSFGSLILIFVLSLRITNDRIAAAAFAVLFMTSEIMVGALGSARNDMMPCFFTLLGVYFFFQAEGRTDGKRIYSFLCGLALAVAVGTKLSYAFAPVSVVLYCLIPFRNKPSGYFQNITLPLILGGTAGSAPIVYFAALSFDNFIYDVFSFHREATPFWYQSFESETHSTWHQRAIQAIRIMLRDGTTSFAVIFIVFSCILSTRRLLVRKLFEEFRNNHGILFAAMVLFSLPLIVAIRASYMQYFIPVVPYLLLIVAAFYAILRGIVPDVTRPLLIAGTVIAMAPGLFFLLKTATAPSAVQTVHSISTEIRQAVKQAGIEGKVATLSPIFVIDAGLPVYREFSAGPFFFRTGDMLMPQRVKALNGVSPDTLESLLDQDPPAAVFVGYQVNPAFPLDGHLENYARQRGYREAQGAFGKGTLFIRTTTANQSGR